MLETNTGEEAIDLRKRHNGPIDLFLPDLSLPGLRGPNLVRMVTTLRPLMRVLFLTGELARALQEFLGRQRLRPWPTEKSQAGLPDRTDLKPNFRPGE